MIVQTQLISNPEEIKRSHNYGFEMWEEVVQCLGCIGLVSELYTLNDLGGPDLPKDPSTNIRIFSGFEFKQLTHAVKARAAGFKEYKTCDEPSNLLMPSASNLLLAVLSSVNTRDNMDSFVSGRLALSAGGSIGGASVLQKSIVAGTNLSTSVAESIMQKASVKRLKLPSAVIDFSHGVDPGDSSRLTVKATVASSRIVNN